MFFGYANALELFELHVSEADHFNKCARAFSRAAHGLTAAGQVASAAVEHRRARGFRSKANKRTNAAHALVRRLGVATGRPALPIPQLNILRGL